MLVKRQPTLKTWSLSAAEVGGMHLAGLSPEKIARRLDLGVGYVAELTDLYLGYKKYSEILRAKTFQEAKVLLRACREAERLRKIRELPIP